MSILVILQRQILACFCKIVSRIRLLFSKKVLDTPLLRRGTRTDVGAKKKNGSFPHCDIRTDNSLDVYNCFWPTIG
jgi:hypothetical protein